MLRHCLHRVEAVPAFGDNLDVRIGRRILAHHRPGERLIVHDHDAQYAHKDWSLVTTISRKGAEAQRKAMGHADHTDTDQVYAGGQDN